MFDFSTAEYSAVGCFLIDSRCLPTIRERISTPEAFASEPCRKAFTAACKLADNGKPVDPVTVGREAGLDNAFLVDCMNTVPSCNGAEAYAQTVTEGFRRRQLRELGDKLQSDLLDAAALGCELFLSGEVREATPYEARETGCVYLAAGHYATEQFGIQALGRVLEREFPELKCVFIPVDNPV